MNRRTFLSAIAALPFARKLVSREWIAESAPMPTAESWDAVWAGMQENHRKHEELMRTRVEGQYLLLPRAQRKARRRKPRRFDAGCGCFP